jgi:DNA-binding IclR family transcriptional regulator
MANIGKRQKALAPSLERGLRILEVVAESRHGRSFTEFTSTLKLPKSSTHSLLDTLQQAGYLRRHERTGRYMFGFRLARLANMGLASMELREQVMPFLSTLTQRTGMTAHLMVLGRFEGIVIGKTEPQGLLRLATWIGKRMDVHCTAGGKALIAHLPEREIANLVDEYGLPRHNDNTIVSLARLIRELAKARTLGYTTDDEEDEIGLRCVGCPILDGTGVVVAAISLSGSVSQITSANRAALVAEVKKTALGISQNLGFRG